MLLKVKSVITWLFFSFCSSSTQSRILSASLDTQKQKKKKRKQKKTYFLFHIIKVSPHYLSLSQWNQPTLTATHSSGVEEARGSIQRPCSEATRLGRKPPQPPPVAWQIAICTAEILILLSKHSQGFPASVVWLTAPVSEGLALCTPNVRPQLDDCLSARGLLSEWWVMWGDGGGWEWAEWGGRAGANCCLRNHSLIWPVGLGCLWEELLPLPPLQLLVPGTDTHPSSQHCGSAAWWRRVFDPCTATWMHSRSLAERTEGRTQARANHLKPALRKRWKQLFLAPLTAWSFLSPSLVVQHTTDQKRHRGWGTASGRWEVWARAWRCRSHRSSHVSRHGDGPV